MKNNHSTKIHVIPGNMVKMMPLTILVLMVCAVFAQQPQQPQNDSISIVDGHPFITWYPNNDNTEKFVIIRKQKVPETSDIIDTIPATETHYHDVSVDACTKWYGYNIMAFDQGQPNSEWSDTLRTILLSQPALNICGNYVNLGWSPYVNMVSSLGGYQVWASENGGDFQLLTPAPITERNFTDSSLSQNTLYTYKVIALNQDGNRTSSSCEVSIRSKTYAKPTFANVLVASVENNNHIQLTWETDPSANISRYLIKRSDGIEFEIPDGTITEYSDTSASFNSQSYDYSIIVYDSCDFKVLETDNIGRTIFLKATSDPKNLQIQLSWNAYADWANGVLHYNIYRKTNDNDPFELIHTTSAGDTSWPDVISQLTDLEGIFTYYVEAVENSSTPLTSKSNQIIVEFETKVLVPNAFIPEGGPPDNVFKPKPNFFDADSYELMIFNKWGQMIFNTTNSDEGWDGKYKGEYVPADAYVYRIRMKSPDGRDFSKQGTVTVIR